MKKDTIAKIFLAFIFVGAIFAFIDEMKTPEEENSTNTEYNSSSKSSTSEESSSETPEATKTCCICSGSGKETTNEDIS